MVPVGRAMGGSEDAGRERAITSAKNEKYRGPLDSSADLRRNNVPTIHVNPPR